MGFYLTNGSRYGIIFTMKNNQITMFNTPCVLYVRETKTVLKEGSWAFLDSMRALTRLSTRKVNIVSKSFYENVLTKR